MSGAPTPQVLLEAIASSAGSPYITNPLPDNPTGTNAASIKEGYPPITMQSELTGGQPPLGQDFNAFLLLISSHTLYVECGQTYKFNSDIATAISGYAVGTILGMTDNSGLWLNILDGNTNNPDTGGAGWVPLNSYGVTTINSLTGGVVTLTVAQSKHNVIVLNGSLASNLILNFPQTNQTWLIINNTTGSFTTTVQTAASGSSGVVISQGGPTAPTAVYSIGDGNIYNYVAPVSLPIDQAPNPLTIAQRTNTGVLTATVFNQNSSLENPTVGSVFVQNSAADGNLRKISLSNFEAQLLLQSIGGAVTSGQVPQAAVSQYFTTTTTAAGKVTVLPDGTRIARGTVNTGDIPGSPTSQITAISLSGMGFTTTPVITVTVQDQNVTSSGNGGVFTPCIKNPSAGGFTVYLNELNNFTQNITLNWIAIGT